MEQVPGPYDSPEYGGETSVEPKPGPLKTLGTLNIVFACGLLLCGACYGFYTFMFAAMNPQFNAQMQAAQAQQQAKRDEEIEELKEKLDEASTDADKARIQSQIDAKQSIPPLPDPSKFSGLKDPKVLGFYIADAASGLILNLIMLIVGCGLVGIREWGRQGGVVLSALKLLRLVVLYTVGIAVIAPTQSKAIADGLAEFMEQIPNQQQQQGAPPTPADLAKVYGVMLSGTFAATMILGAIYPAISLWILTRPGSKAATSRPISY